MRPSFSIVRCHTSVTHRLLHNAKLVRFIEPLLSLSLEIAVYKQRIETESPSDILLRTNDVSFRTSRLGRMRDVVLISKFYTRI